MKKVIRVIEDLFIWVLVISIFAYLLYTGVSFYDWFIHRCIKDELHDPTAICYSDVHNTNWFNLLIGFFPCMAFMLVGWAIMFLGPSVAGFVGPRGGEYHYSKNGNSKIYTTNS
jgi:hypothetical protein